MYIYIYISLSIYIYTHIYVHNIVLYYIILCYTMLYRLHAHLPEVDNNDWIKLHVC